MDISFINVLYNIYVFWDNFYLIFRYVIIFK